MVGIRSGFLLGETAYFQGRLLLVSGLVICHALLLQTIHDLRKVLETAMWIGVDREKANQRDIQPIHLAAANGHAEILQHLLNEPWKGYNKLFVETFLNVQVETIGTNNTNVEFVGGRCWMLKCVL